MDFYKNIGLNLTAAGPAAVVIVWIVCVTVLGIYGKLYISWFAMIVLNIGGAFIIHVFGNKVRLEEFKAAVEALEKSRVNPNKHREDAEEGKNHC